MSSVKCSGFIQLCRKVNSVHRLNCETDLISLMPETGTLPLVGCEKSIIIIYLMQAEAVG